MSPAVLHTPPSEQTLYPDSDGQPMAENTLQYDWIVRLVTNWALTRNNCKAYGLTSRQMGNRSLMIRTAEPLRQRKNKILGELLIEEPVSLGY